MPTPNSANYLGESITQRSLRQLDANQMLRDAMRAARSAPTTQLAEFMAPQFGTPYEDPGHTRRRFAHEALGAFRDVPIPTQVYGASANYATAMALDAAHMRSMEHNRASAWQRRDILADRHAAQTALAAGLAVTVGNEWGAGWTSAAPAPAAVTIDGVAAQPDGSAGYSVRNDWRLEERQARAERYTAFQQEYQQQPPVASSYDITPEQIAEMLRQPVTYDGIAYVGTPQTADNPFARRFAEALRGSAAAVDQFSQTAAAVAPALPPITQSPEMELMALELQIAALQAQADQLRAGIAATRPSCQRCAVAVPAGTEVCATCQQRQATRVRVNARRLRLYTR